MDLSEFKLLICSNIGIDSTRSVVTIYFKYDMSGQLLAFSVEDDKLMWEHSKSTMFPRWSYR